MISVEKAWLLIRRNGLRPAAETLPVSQALGRAAAADVRAALDSPGFDNSAMDGFALRSADTAAASASSPVSLALGRPVKAGDEARTALRRGEACPIMTGSPVPPGADAVIEKEKAEASGSRLIVRAPVEKGRNIRRRGEEIRKGATILRRGAVLNPGTVGFLTALGAHRVSVYRLPRVGLLATGSELVEPGKKLRRGKIYDSNTPMIVSALRQAGIEPAHLRRLPDSPLRVREAVRGALKRSDVLILMGGVSVGDYDVVKEALSAAGVKTVFWKVSQKPGKPLYFGRTRRTLAFGLPGNPASVYTCFYEYVYPAIRAAAGFAESGLKRERLALASGARTDRFKTLFVKARVVGGARRAVLPLGRQKSHMLSPFCEADAFAVLPPSVGAYAKGEIVDVHMLPYAAGGPE